MITGLIIFSFLVFCYFMTSPIRKLNNELFELEAKALLEYSQSEECKLEQRKREAQKIIDLKNLRNEVISLESQASN